ncbi:glycosyltransferase, partial [Proteus mirabilis]
NYISPHMTFLYEELIKDYSITIIICEDFDTERLSQGWTPPDLKNIQVLNVRDINIVTLRNIKCIHVFCGLFTSKLFFSYIIKLSKYRKVHLISEAPIFFKKIHYLKYLKYWIYSLFLKNRINTVFAMGELGYCWFKKIGFKKVIPFQYFITPHIYNSEKKTISKNIKFIYIGQLIDRKNVLELASTFSKLSNDNWSLDIYGSGKLFEPLQKKLKNKIKDNKVHIFNNINNEKLVTEILPQYDYLILPSKFDGWGTVVNESLSQGVKVITNNRCGSSTLVKKNILFGYIYKVGELDNCITNIINTTQSPSEEERLKISTLYRDVIQYKMIELFKKNLENK